MNKSVLNKSRHVFSSLVLVLLLSACGGGGGGGGGNTPLVADAGPDQNVNEGSLVQLMEQGGNGGGVTYLWTQTAGPNVALSSNNVSNPSFTAPQITTANVTLTFQLAVSDGNGGNASDSIDVVVNDVPVAGPVVDAGGDQVVGSGDSVQLSGSVSGNSPPFTISWTQSSGVSVSLSDSTITNPSFTAPVVNAGETEILTFDLTVTDNNGAVSVDSVMVTVNGPTPPPPPPPSNVRIKEVTFDYDNNGTADAVTTYTYDAAGRLVRDEHVYTDDGTANKFELLEPSSVTIEFAYDTNGRMSMNKRTEGQDIQTFNYTYDVAGNITRADIEVQTVGLVSQTYALYTYSGGRVTQYNLYRTDNNQLQLTVDYTYDGNGRITDEMGLSPFGAAFANRYTWDTQGRVDLIERDLQGDGGYEITEDYIFGNNAPLFQRVHANTNPFAGPYETYTETFTYDGNGMYQRVDYDNANDGSLDANAQVTQTESGPCVGTYIPILLPHIGNDGVPGSNGGDFDLCQ